MAGDVFAFKAIKPQKLRVDKIRQEILNALRKEGREQVKQLKKTTKNWRNPPDFEFLIGLTRGPNGGATVVSGPVGRGTGSRNPVAIWQYLNQGTSIRWALMSRDWRSKTRPNSFQSGRGRGRVVIAGRRAMTARGIGPRPGIEARNWSTILTKRRKRPFTRRMIKAMQRGAKKLVP